MSFKAVNPKQSFPELELDILKFWRENDVFRKSVENRQNAQAYTFYDGPPFATGLPHYGHILAGTIKDVIPRYQTMRGYRVERRFGWDCHGLPIENLIEKELNLQDKKALLEYGIANFNEACCASVLRYSNEWEEIVERMGRWVDFRNDYKTMDPEFMESVWWVFDQLWQKGLVYEGHKPMHICPRCVTPLSNFEVNLGYKEITDQSVVAKFKVKSLKSKASVPLEKGDLGGLKPQGIKISQIKTSEEHTEFKKVAWEILAKDVGREEYTDEYFKDFIAKFGAFKDGKMIACAGLKKKAEGVVELREIGVKSEWRKKGIGKQIVLAVFDYAKKQGNKKCVIDARVGVMDFYAQFNPYHTGNFSENESGKHEVLEVDLEKVDSSGVTPLAPLDRGEQEPTYLLAWTTTPWTLPGNVALAVNPEVEYVKVEEYARVGMGEIVDKSSDKRTMMEPREGYYIVAKNLVDKVFGQSSVTKIIGKPFKGSELVGLEYEPLFPYFAEDRTPLAPLDRGEQESPPDKGDLGGLKPQGDGNSQINFGGENPPTPLVKGGIEQDVRGGLEQNAKGGEKQTAFRVVAGDFVTTEEGTGIVHIAPAFGEDDLNVGKKENLPWVQHVTMEGKFTSEVSDFAGMDVKPKDDPMKTDRKIVEFLKKQNKVFAAETYRHSYPHCWRCETPLLNYATSSWFVKVEQIKQKLLGNNQEIAWVPEHLKNGRFGKWLENARDWAISRTRYWGTPLPVWRCENADCKHTESLGSIESLEQKTGQKVTDIHKHFVDNLIWDCPKCAGKMRRIEEVFDCWFESGSMPYAQKHYPFAYNRKLKNTYYVLRHGEGEHNVSNMISCDPEYGCRNTALTEKGKTEVRKNARIFQKIKVDLIFSSDFLRTKQTAEILQEVVQKEIVYDVRLREFNVGEFHQKTIEEYENSFPKKEEKWTRAPLGGETYADMEKRMSDFFNEVEGKYKGKTIVIISHGDPLKILLGFLNAEYKKITAYAACPQKGVPQRVELKTAEDFLKIFPADFIAEGLDQTRGWFYTLHVLASALFEKPAFRNVIVNGIVLAEDGQKMSKSKQNYPDPNLIFQNYGADAMRFYLMNSPVVKADDLRFTESGVNEIVKGMILPLWNSYSFFVTYANIDGWEPFKVPLEKGDTGGLKPQGCEQNPPTLLVKGGLSNKLDRWILSALNQLIAEVTREMDNYDLQKAATPIFGFIDNLTNWYIRRSRRRFWKSENDEDKGEAYATLYEVLVKTAQIIAPFMPFLAEEIYQNLICHSCEGRNLGALNNPLTQQNANHQEFNKIKGTKPKVEGSVAQGERDSRPAKRENDKNKDRNDNFFVSVHLTDWPKVDEGLIDRELNQEMALVQKIVKLGLAIRAKEKIKVRQPLNKIDIVVPDKIGTLIVKNQAEIIKEELNIKRNVHVWSNADKIAEKVVIVNARVLGPRLGKKVQEIIKVAKEGKFEILENGGIKILDEILNGEEISIGFKGKEGQAVESDQGVVVALDTTLTEELKLEGMARDLVRLIQDMRKEADYKVDDRITLYLDFESELLQKVLTNFKKYIKIETLSKEIKFKRGKQVDLEKEAEVEGERILIGLNKN